MSSSVNQEYGQFSVIARLRHGTGSSLSTFGIILAIQEHLKAYRCICNVSLSAPNFVIHLPMLELQLQILACREFRGPDYVLDIVPWCAEYASFDLPWLFGAINGDSGVTDRLDKDSTYGLNILSGAALQDVSPESLVGSTSGINQACFLPEEIPIVVDAAYHPAHADVTMDFSYLMVVELKQFYIDKFSSFQICQQICTEMYNVAQLFSTETNRVVKSVQQETNFYSALPYGDMLHRIAVFGGDLDNILWFISEEIFSLRLSLASGVGSAKVAMDLAKFVGPPANQEFTVPVSSVDSLRTIAVSTVLRIYGKTPLFATAEDYDQVFSTQIWCSTFHHEYKAAKVMMREEAEASSVYRFLKYITNVLGYGVDDENSHVLSAVVSELVAFGVSISEMQLEVNKVTTMVHAVHDDMIDLHSRIPPEIIASHASHVGAKINDLFILLQHYTDVVDQASETFAQHKRVFRNIKFKSGYPAKPNAS